MSSTVSADSSTDADVSSSAIIASSTLVDLSQNWVVDIDADAQAALDAVVEDDILAYSLVHGGKIVAEYYRSGRDETDTAQIWSVTKSWASLLIGTLVKDGLLTRQTTLGEVFDPGTWKDVDDADAKRLITIEDLLQMESGYEKDGSYLGHVWGGFSPKNSVLASGAKHTRS